MREGGKERFNPRPSPRGRGAELAPPLDPSGGRWFTLLPRDREGNFEPKLICKHERRFTGFDDKIIAMYARGMTIREIQGFLSQMYATDVTPELISRVTDAVLAEVIAW